MFGYLGAGSEKLKEPISALHVRKIFATMFAIIRNLNMFASVRTCSQIPLPYENSCEHVRVLMIDY